jgi:nuclear GTP-binding protein
MHEGKDEVEVVMKGCIRAEKLEDPTFYIPSLLTRVKPEVLIALYKIENFEDDADFLKQVGRKKGKLVKGGEVDISTTAKLVLMDW